MRARRCFQSVGAALALGLAGCFPLPAEIPSAPAHFDPAQIEGTWFILATNFPQWTGDSNTEAHLIYHQRKTEDGSVQLDDRVEFLSDGSPSSYVGFDLQDFANSTHFTWRGNGILALFPTEWYVAIVDPKAQWLVTYYGDTVPAQYAVDVIARTPTLDESEVKAALDAIDRDSFLRPRAKGMKRVHLYASAKSPAPKNPAPEPAN